MSNQEHTKTQQTQTIQSAETSAGAKGLSLPAVPVLQSKAMAGDGGSDDNGTQQANPSAPATSRIKDTLHQLGAKPQLQAKGMHVDATGAPVVQRIAFSSKDMIREAKDTNHWYRFRIWFDLVDNVKAFEAENDIAKKNAILKKMLVTTKSWKDKNKDKKDAIKIRKREVIEQLELQIHTEFATADVKGDSSRQDKENKAVQDDPLAKIKESLAGAMKKGTALAAHINDVAPDENAGIPALKLRPSLKEAEEEFKQMATTFDLDKNGLVIVSSKGEQGLFKNTYDMATGKVTASENVRDDKKAKYLQNADVFQLQWEAARNARLETAPDPGITEVTRTPNNWLTRAVMRAGLVGVADVEQKLDKKKGLTGKKLSNLMPPPPDNSYTYKANKAEYELMMGTINGQSVAFMVADRMKSKTISKVDVKGGDMVFTISEKEKKEH